MRIKVSMGFFAFSNGRTHFSRKTRGDLVHYRIPEGFFVIELAVQRALRHSRCGQNDVHVSASKFLAVHLLECRP
jgi:hypothetical protein